MYCAKCGKELASEDRFCSSCGTPVQAAAAGAAWGGAPAGWAPGGSDWVSRLQRPRANRMVAGVCAGLAQHYHWDLTWTRVITVLIAIFSSGAGLVAYLVFWIVMPEEAWALPSNIGAAPGPTPPNQTTPPGAY
jgi:phage shock protein C